MLNHNYIVTEHILLGLIHEAEGIDAKALESLRIRLETVWQQVEEIIGQGQPAQSTRHVAPSALATAAFSPPRGGRRPRGMAEYVRYRQGLRSLPPG